MAESIYNQVLYPGHAYTETQPTYLGALATLFGLSPPPVETARVLDVGCGDGSNLLPLAHAFPDAHFVGFDLAEEPVAMARATALRLALSNVAFHAANIVDITPSFGTFDYIIAHGFYAWVPPLVQEKLLSVCGANLSPNGVAFVSYNSQPAGHTRAAMRQIMRFHAAQLGPTATVNEARDFLATLAELVPPNESAALWKATLQAEAKRLKIRHADVVFHDDLADCYSPTSVSEFAATAAQHGLEFITDADLRDAVQPSASPEALAQIDKLAAGNRIARQQYLDFANGQGFHRSLICHAGVGGEPQLNTGHMEQIFVASPLRQSRGAPGKFQNSRSAGTMSSNEPLVQKALAELEKAWPLGLRVSDLEDRIGLKDTTAREPFRQTLLKLAANRLLDLRLHQPRVPSSVPRLPLGSAVARLQVQHGSVLTTLLHGTVELEQAPVRHLLTLLDGKRDSATLRSSLAMAFPDQPQSLESIATMLAAFRGMGLLESSS